MLSDVERKGVEEWSEEEAAIKKEEEEEKTLAASADPATTFIWGRGMALHKQLRFMLCMHEYHVLSEGKKRLFLLF